ncbi:MAG: trypsin-like serine peptidase [Actinocrinis sp.]
MVSIGTLALYPIGARGVASAHSSTASNAAQGNQSAANAPNRAGSTPASRPFSGLPQVGALFGYSNGTTTSHFCSASVVSSSVGDIVITAAHCVYNTSSGTYTSAIAFVPGYHDGRQPYGVWTPSKIVVAPQWINAADPDYDVAFLIVHDRSGSARRIQDAVGSDELKVGPAKSGQVRVVGYPSSTEQPVTCSNAVKALSGTQVEFDCLNLPDGTSGGPFLAGPDPATGRRAVVGVIGGYQTGGDTPDISYSAYFGSQVADLFSQAEALG